MSEATNDGFKDDVYNKNDDEISTSSDDTENTTELSVENSTELSVENTTELSVENTTENLALKMAETLNKVDEMLKYPEKSVDLKDLKDLMKDIPFFVPTGIYTPLNEMTMEVFKQTLGEKVVKDLNNYEKYHQNKANKQIHYMALISNIFYTMALLSVFNTTFIKVDFIVFLFYILYYKLYGSDCCAVFMAGFLGNIYTSSKIYTLMLPNHFWYSLLMVSCSWFSQFYGHIIYEKNSPALTTSLTQSLTIAPVHLAIESLEKMGGVIAVAEGFLESQIYVAKKIDMVSTWYRNRNRKKQKNKKV
jgi:uncharacterized membrane protein YGL010W